MASVYDNGGMLGVTLDFADTEKYILGTTINNQPITHVASSGTGQTITGTTIPLPNDLQQGDLVIVGTSSDTERYPGDFSDPTGYTLGQASESGVQGVWWYKFMGSTPDTQVSGLLNDSRTTHFYSVFRGVDQVSTIASTATPNSATTGMPNPPSLSATADNMVLAMGFLDDDNIASSVTAPSGYTLSASSNATSAGASIMLAYKTSAGGTEDPEAFGGSGTDAWVGMTAELARVGDTDILGNQKNSGIWNIPPKRDNMIGADLDFRNTERYIVGQTIAPATSVTFVNSTASTTASITIPANAQTGDIAILAHGGGDRDSQLVPNTPSGWNVIAAGAAPLGRIVAPAMGLFYKVLSSSDLASPTLTLGPSYAGAFRKLIAVFRADIPLTTEGVSAVSLNSEFTLGDPSPQTISISGQTLPVIAFVNHYSDAAVAPRSSSVVMSEIQGGSTAHWFRYQTYNANSNPPNITVDQDDEGSNTMISGALVLQGGVQQIFGNQKNSSIWDIRSVTEAIQTLSI